MKRPKQPRKNDRKRVFITTLGDLRSIIANTSIPDEAEYHGDIIVYDEPVTNYILALKQYEQDLKEYKKQQIIKLQNEIEGN